MAKGFLYLLEHTPLLQIASDQEKEYVRDEKWDKLWISLTINHSTYIIDSIQDALHQNHTDTIKAWSTLLYICPEIEKEERDIIADVVRTSKSFSDRLTLAKHGWVEYKGRQNHRKSPHYILCQWMFLVHAHELWIDYNDPNTVQKWESVVRNVYLNVSSKYIVEHPVLTPLIFAHHDRKESKTDLLLAALEYPNFKTSIYAAKYFGNIREHIKTIYDHCIYENVVSLDLSHIFDVSELSFVTTMLVLKEDHTLLAKEWLDVLYFWKESYPEHSKTIEHAIHLTEAVYFPNKTLPSKHPLTVLASIVDKKQLVEHMQTVIHHQEPSTWWSMENTTIPLEIDFSHV